MKCQRFDLSDRHIAIIEKAQLDGELTTLVAALRFILDKHEELHQAVTYEEAKRIVALRHSGLEK